MANSVEESVEEFKTFLAASGFWASLVNSQFVEHLARWFYQVERRVYRFMERKFQEFFISVAVNEDSIIAHAADRLYLPRKRVPSFGPVNIVNNSTTETFSVAAYNALASQDGLDYVSLNAVSLLPGQNADSVIRQVEVVEISGTIDIEEQYHKINLADKVESIRLANVKVYLDEGLGEALWEPSLKFHNTSPDSEAYVEQFTPLNELEIVFGDGLAGKIPEGGASYRIVCELTDGLTTLASGELLALTGDNANPEIVITSTGPIDGGSERESIEEIRNSARYYPAHDDQLVWQDDFIFYTRKGIANINWMKFWGEAEQEVEAGAMDVDFINRLYFSAHSPDNADVMVDILARLELTKRYNYRYTPVAPEYVTYTCTIIGTVQRHEDNIAKANEVKKLLLNTYGKDVPYQPEKPQGGRPVEVALKDFYKLIEDSGLLKSFDITLAGTFKPTKLNQMVYLDIGTSVFTIGY